ncbi:MAG: 1-acyl-sn-glycerol-3-phosphate acyltransferase [Vicingaceae bacterium]
MFYKFIQFLLQQFLHFHFDEIKSSNQQAVPKEGPLIIAASHPNSFLDAIILAAILKRPLHFLARSDVFAKKWSDFLLRKLNLIPIYRLKEGKDNLHKNEETFAACHQILKEGGALLIFAEGVSIGDKLIRPLKKGLGRIAYSYVEQYPNEKPPKIVACGINYEHINHFGSKILVGYSETIAWEDLRQNSSSFNAQSLNLLNKRILAAIKEHSIVVSPEDEKLHQALVELDPCYEQNSLIRKALIAEKIALLKKEDPQKYQALKQEILKMDKILTPYHLDFQSMKHKVEVNTQDFFLYFLLWPFALFGLVLNALPFLLGKAIAKRTTQKDPEFYLSVRFTVGSFLWLLWTLSFTLLLSLMGHAIFILSPLVFYFLGRVYQANKQRWKLINRLRWIKKIKSNQGANSGLQEEIRKILKLRTSLGLMPKS